MPTRAILILCTIAFTAIYAIGEDMPDTTRFAERDAMVTKTIERRGVGDEKVLRAMREVSRHRFVPAELHSFAYDDRPLPIGLEQTISQPYIVALMTELAGIDSSSKVLEIGTGSGYQAAILAEIVDSVFSIEIICELADRATSILDTLGYDNIAVKCGDGYRGWPEHAPFDAIIVTAAPPKIPEPLVEQLIIGGKMVIPVGNLYQELMTVTKTEDGSITQSVIPVRFVPMTGEAQEE
jgi:protein-L-isoaspartate(D-aspartate) O-methyltransferase